jgi:hypothetical protein
MWDLWVDGPPVLPETELSRRVKRESEGRKIMIFIGMANYIKGFPELVETAQREHESLLVVVAGRVAQEYADEVALLRRLGMIVEDRYVSDDEVLSLYNVADYAWCRYAPEYDQASGVFGRAIQTGVMPVVRTGSVVHQLLKSCEGVSAHEIMTVNLAKLKEFD